MAGTARNSGFTLIEVMIVTVIVVVLALVALPAFQDAGLKARRADGKSALLGLQLAQEKFRANCRFYAGALSNADVCGTDAASSTLNFSATSKEGYYNLAITAATGNSFTITADPTGSQATDNACDPLQIVFPAGDRTPVDCWR